MVRNDIKLEMISIYPRSEDAIVDFALKMVRRHHDELVKIIGQYDDGETQLIEMLEAIREAKP